MSIWGSYDLGERAPEAAMYEKDREFFDVASAEMWTSNLRVCVGDAVTELTPDEVRRLRDVLNQHLRRLVEQ